MMKLDVMGLLGACSYALDCVEAELVQVAPQHAKRVAYLSVCTAEALDIHGRALQDLAACALLHDNALTQYIQEELHGNTALDENKTPPRLGVHCTLGEENLRSIPFCTDVKNVILYHHERADGTGPFGRTWREVPLFARIIHLCDMLDVFCRTSTFTHETWTRAERFLREARGKAVDDEVLDAFFRAMPEEKFLALGGGDLKTRLWQKIPREARDLRFDQVRALADFFARIVDYKSPFTSTHSLGVAADAAQLAEYMGFPRAQVEQMYLAGALHDIGKVAVGNEILEKPGKLTAEEYAVMKHHAAYSYAILSEIEGFETLRDWAAFHHERLDGTGYPFGKTAEELDVPARMMACIDIYQALTESRPYKAGMPHEKACGILRDMAGKGWIDATITEQVADCFAPQTAGAV